MMSETPRRSHVVTIKIGADTWDDILTALRTILTDQELNGPYPTVASGGSSFGYVWEHDHDPGITHDSYFEAIEKERGK
jgi:hypothetical protein